MFRANWLSTITIYLHKFIVMSNDNIQAQFANRLIELRKKRNLSQEELALLCGVDRSYIGRIERLERNPSLVILNKIAKGLNMNLSELLNMQPAGWFQFNRIDI